MPPSIDLYAPLEPSEPTQEIPETREANREARVREITGVVLEVAQRTIWDNPQLTMDEARLAALRVITGILNTVTAETAERVNQRTRDAAIFQAAAASMAAALRAKAAAEAEAKG